MTERYEMSPEQQRLIKAAHEMRDHMQACGWPKCACPEDKPGQVTCPSTGCRINYPYRETSP